MEKIIKMPKKNSGHSVPELRKYKIIISNIEAGSHPKPKYLKKKWLR